jgi:hypothetical protein
MTSSARFYLNNLDADGVLIGDTEMAADAIVYTHEVADNYLDVRPIVAALKYIHKRRDRDDALWGRARF